MPSIPVTNGLRLLLDARTLSLANAASVAFWTDGSGGVSHATGAGGSQPTYRTNIINGLPVVRFAGGGQRMSGTFSNFATGFAGFTLMILMANFVVASSTDFAGLACLHQGGATADQLSAGGVTIEAGQGETDTRPTWTSSHQAAHIGYRYLIPIEPTVIGATASPTQQRSITNGVTATIGWSRGTGVASAGYTLATRYQSGVSASFTAALDIAMVAAFNRALTSAEANAVANWMRTEYAIVPSSTLSLGEVHG